MSMSLRKRKGEAALFAIVALAVSGIIALGLAKIQYYGTHTLDTSEEFLKAEQYALEVTEELRSTSFSAVAALPKTKISSGVSGDKDENYRFGGYYKEVVINRDGIFKDCKVNIYKDDTDRPVLSLSVAKVDPKALVWGGLSDNFDESTESGGNRSWSAQTTQNYVGGKLINDYTAVDADGSFSAAASVDYINNKLKDYIEKEKSLNRISKSAVGSNRQPIFVNGNREAAVCNVSYRLNENTAAPNIGVLRKDSSGNIQLDYWDHDSYFNGNNTSGTTTPDTGSGGGSTGGSTVAPSVGKFDGCRWTYKTEGWNHKVIANTFDKTEEDSNGRLWHVFKTCSNTKYLVIIVAGDSGTSENPCTTDLLLKDSINNELEMPDGISWFSLGNIADSRIVVEVTPDSYYKVWGDVFDDYNEGYESLAINVIELDPSQTKVDIENGKAYNDSILSPGLGKYSFVRFYSF